MGLRAVVAAAVTALAACAEDSTAPSRYLVYDRDSSGTFRLGPAEITTLDDPHTGIGSVAKMRGGGRIAAGSEGSTTEEQLRQLIQIEGDSDPNIQFSIDDDGVAVPFDFDSLLMLSLYHHLERASSYFAALSVEPSSVRQLPIYYKPRLLTILGIPIPLFTDNAAYAPTIDAFLIPPTFVLKDVPLVANRGVVVHEYSHVVFNRLAHEDRRVPRYFLDDWPAAAAAELRSLDEGLADIHGALETGDPNFIGPSISAALFEIDRDVSIDRTYDSALLQKVESSSIDTYNPYPLGSVVASTLWDLPVDRTILGALVVEASRGLAPLESTFSLARFFDLVHDGLPASSRPEACRLFHTRLEAIASRLACTPPE